MLLLRLFLFIRAAHLVQLALVGQTLGHLAVLVDAHVLLGRMVVDSLGSLAVGHHELLLVAPLSELKPKERLG